MKTEHYPSLELCIKLTEIGFPETEHSWDNNGEEENFENRIMESSYGLYVCPSAMEMLDVMPTERICTYWHSTLGARVRWDGGNYVTESISLPNALAEMVIWLHDNNYIFFTK